MLRKSNPLQEERRLLSWSYNDCWLSRSSGRLNESVAGPSLTVDDGEVASVLENTRTVIGDER
jgi:hypothetical protein